MLGLVAILIAQSLSPFALVDDYLKQPSTGRDGEVWVDDGIHWPQFGRTPGHEAVTPAHDPVDPQQR